MRSCRAQESVSQVGLAFAGGRSSRPHLWQRSSFGQALQIFPSTFSILCALFLSASVLPLQAAGSFTISASPSSESVLPSQAAMYSVNITKSGGFSGTVSLSVNGLPSGASGTFSPPTITGSGLSNLNVSTASSTPTGTALAPWADTNS
jgi:hypothetical protein